MATYSAFFSSGLLAPHIARPVQPIAISTTGVDRQLSLTPTPLSPKAPEAYRNAERPKMRRRRSSINIGASPMALIKSPVRNAGAALQRTGFVSPTRHRAASVNKNEALEGNSLFGRLKSESASGMNNPPRRLRRAVRFPVPLAPPPSVPLPALPPSPTARCGTSLLPPIMLDSVPRQPLAIRSSRADNAADLFLQPLSSPTLLSPDFVPKIPFRMSPGHSAACDGTIDEGMREY